MLLQRHTIKIAFPQNSPRWLSTTYKKRKILANFRTKIIFGEKIRKDSQVKDEEASIYRSSLLSPWGKEKPLPTLPVREGLDYDLTEWKFP